MTKPKPKTSPAKPSAAAAAPAVDRPRRPRARAAKPKTEPVPPPKPTKLHTLALLLQRKQGATLEQLMAATGWQAHSVRGALAGAMLKHFGAKVVSEKVDGGRVYRAPKI